MSDQISSTKQIITKIVEDVFDKKLDNRLDEINQRLEKLEENQSKTLEILTDVMGELKASREEQQLLTHKVYHDHESRLETVETKLNLGVS